MNFYSKLRVIARNNSFLYLGSMQLKTTIFVRTILAEQCLRILLRYMLYAQLLYSEVR